MRIRITIILAAALAAVSASAVEAVREVFDNGLTAIVAENHANPVAAVRVYVRAGSIYEGKYLGAGMSHYIEHLLGERTDKHTKAELEAAVSEMGGAYNAYTWKDHVCYHIAVRADKVDEADVRSRLLNEFQIEIGAGLGPLAGKIWRIGLMGHTARPESVDRVLCALRSVL